MSSATCVAGVRDSVAGADGRPGAGRRRPRRADVGAGDVTAARGAAGAAWHRRRGHRDRPKRRWPMPARAASTYDWATLAVGLCRCPRSTSCWCASRRSTYPAGVYEATLGESARVARDAVIVSVPFDERRHLSGARTAARRSNPSYHFRSLTPGGRRRISLPGSRSSARWARPRAARCAPGVAAAWPSRQWPALLVCPSRGGGCRARRWLSVVAAAQERPQTTPRGCDASPQPGHAGSAAVAGAAARSTAAPAWASWRGR